MTSVPLALDENQDTFPHLLAIATVEHSNIVGRYMAFRTRTAD